MDQAWEIVGLWWTRVEVRSARIHNYEPLPSFNTADSFD